MSKINAVRFINLNYNNQSIRISDETFHLNGESTLLSLRNGGGKSVLVQMLTAPFVHKRYRDAKDRPFESYFTTAKPSFILVEWALDQGTGFALTGMMVRKNQDDGEQTAENLEMLNFICEYPHPCAQDIHRLPVIEKGKKEICLKSFSACRQLFESYKKTKKDSPAHFFYYDMNNAAQSRQYFEKLAEYQIHYKEWETIIKKINLKESGLSDLFNDCRDEKGLVEKWFLEAVESKLNKDQDRIKEFQNILEKYVSLYKDNQTKIQYKDAICRFREEAAPIQSKAESYQEAQTAETCQENRIVAFTGEIGRLRGETAEELSQALEGIQQIRRQIEWVAYEKISAQIYHLQEKQKYQAGNREILEMERDALEKEIAAVEKKIHLLICAKWQEQTDEDKREWTVAKERLQLHRKKAQDLEPEQKSLGYTLKRHYQNRTQENQDKRKENQEASLQTDLELAQEKEKLKALGEELLEAVARQGALRSQADAYGQQEEIYNNRYQEQLVRNILGEYEPGSMENRLSVYQKTLEDSLRSRMDTRKEQEKLHNELHSLERAQNDLRESLLHAKTNLTQAEEQEAVYQQELTERRTILQYLDLGEKDIFNLDKILETSSRKLSEIAALRRGLEKEEDQRQKEYLRLTQGKVLELPKELENMLQNLGIPIVYGMEWLKKNNCSPEEKERLTAAHPFLPYALLLSRTELEKLSRHQGEIYTSFPVPILLREELSGTLSPEESANADMPGSVIHTPQAHFYLLFNQNLLDEEKLQLLVQEKERQIEKIQESIRIRQLEYQEYFARQERIKNQTVTQKNYDQIQKRQKDLKNQIQKLEDQLKSAAQKLAEEKEAAEHLAAALRRADQEIDLQKRRLEDYTQLLQAYQTYNQRRKELEQCQRQIERLTNRQQISQNSCEELQERQRTLDADRESLRLEKQELENCLRQYESYEESPLQSGDIQEMEARYQAITAGMTQEIRELENQQQLSARRYGKSLEELECCQKKYGLLPQEWADIRYSRKEETHLETLRKDKEKKHREKDRLWNDAKTAIAVIDGQITACQKKMLEECGQKTPLPKEEIQDQDYEARKNQLLFQEKEAQKEANALQARLQSYDENLTALAEYAVAEPVEEIQWEQDFRKMDAESLRKFKGILLRDYNQKSKERMEAREDLLQTLHQVVRMEDFREEFYRKPLESMIKLTHNPTQVLLQLTTTLQSYENLMEKLEVDISIVDKEKQKIVELLHEYIWDVHQNLGKIDQNSTISIRGQSVKMLKIQIPEWEENQNLYLLRLQDLIDEITQKGLELFERNENAQEYFGTQITTRSLYDAVVGVGNVQIRLYKIEEQREYAITWAEVARNSGGEGFLSAFVILSSLLYYMRKDESDIFADKNQGKVLLMDNPFAQTNAAHLLKPLMDVAKKSNTQLICLSGLGGESIYNRFDNIYVLNLLSASLRAGCQYLKAEHLQGSEPEEIVASQIQVTKQQELLF